MATKSFKHTSITNKANIVNRVKNMMAQKEHKHEGAKARRLRQLNKGMLTQHNGAANE